jgi:tetratricopeptide (TPR) repeat protein
MYNRYLKLLLMFSLIFSSLLFAQFEGMDDEEDATPAKLDEPCEPESFATPHEYLGATELGRDKVNFYMFEVKNAAKKQEWERVKKFGWQLIYGDKKRTYKSIYDYLAQAYFYTNSPDTTLLLSQMGLNDAGDRTTLHYYAGLIHFKVGRFHCAEKHYLYLKDRDKDNIGYWRALVTIYLKLNNQDAIAAQERVVELSGNDPKEQAKLAELYRKFGLNAIDAYFEGWANNPTIENLKAAIMATKMALEQGEYLKGIKVAEEALAVAPNNKSLLLNAANLYLNNQQSSNAIDNFKKYIAVDDSNVDVYCALSAIYREQQNWSLSRSYALKGTKADPNSGKPYLFLGDLYIAAASECTNSKFDGVLKYDAKLVYEKAYNNFSRAKKDPMVSADASAKMTWLKSSEYLPTKADRFLYKYDQPKADCYKWIN